MSGIGAHSANGGLSPELQLARGHYRAVIRDVALLAEQANGESDVWKLIRLASAAADGLASDFYEGWNARAAAQLRAYELVIHLGEAALVHPHDDPEGALQVAQAHFDRGRLLATSSRRRHQAVAAFDAVWYRAGPQSELPLQLLAADARLAQAAALNIHDYLEAVPLWYGDVVARFGESRVPALQQRVVQALRGMGYHWVIERPQAALDAYAEVRHRFGDVPNPAVQAEVSHTLRAEADQLVSVGRYAEAVRLLGEVADRVADAADPALQELGANALQNQDFDLNAWLKDPEAAIAVYQRLAERYGESDLPYVQEMVARGVINQAITLGELGRWPESAHAYEQMIGRAPPSPTGIELEWMTEARVRLADVLAELGRPAEALALVDQVIAEAQRRDQSLADEYVVWARYQRGWYLRRLGRTTEALENYHQLEADPVALAMVGPGALVQALARLADEDPP